MSDDDSAAQRILALAGLLAIIAAAIVVTAYCSGCSAGPQLPIVTTPISISCTWNNMDGGASEDCDCMVDRSSAAAEGNPTGIRTETGDISPSVSVPISGTGGGTP